MIASFLIIMVQTAILIVLAALFTVFTIGTTLEIAERMKWVDYRLTAGVVFMWLTFLMSLVAASALTVF